MDQQQFEAMLSDVEIRLRRLKTLYEQWFAGVERTEPSVARKEVDDLLARLRREQVRNTALRFRLQQVIQRHTTFTTYWRRIARQIEEGTYQRDVLKARKLREQRDKDKRSGQATDSFDVDVELDWNDEVAQALSAAEEVASDAPSARTTLSDEPVDAAVLGRSDARPDPSAKDTLPEGLQVPSAPPAAAAKRPPVPPPPPKAALGARSISPFALPLPGPGDRAPAPNAPAAGSGPPRPPALGPTVPKPALARPSVPRPALAHPTANGNAQLSTEDVQRIYARYLAARQKNAERTDNVRIDTIERTLRSMLPQLEKKHAGKKIDFEVVVKDGKVALKPVAR